jgi:hypothetical protein
MNMQAFKSAYHEPRNGTDAYHRSPLYPNFIYSDGVKECAEAGCYWLLDKLGTELPAVFDKNEDMASLLVEVDVAEDNTAVIRGTWEDGYDNPQNALYHAEMDYTDLPAGQWQFYVGRDTHPTRLICILLTEY